MVWLLLFGMLSLVGAVGTVINVNRVRFQRRLARELQALVSVPASDRVAGAVMDLPLPVARYQRLAVGDRAPVHRLRLRHGGTFRMSPSSKPVAIQGSQDFTADPLFEGRNILHAAEPLASLARALRIEPTAFEQEIGASREALYQARARRAPPLRDEKILTAWNGLMISAAARAAFILADPALLTQVLLGELRTRFLPNRVLSVVSAGEMLRAHSRVIPLLESKVARRGQVTAYVCERRVCELPTSDPALFRHQLDTGPRAGH